MGRSFQPCESHLQYIPQWMCDYNLYGCAYMKSSKAVFRSPVPEYLELTDLSHRWHDRSVPSDWISDEAVFPKQSHCSLEVDICVQDILNRMDVRERHMHQDFSEMLKPPVHDGRLVPSMAGLWKDETRRRKKRLGIIDPGSSPFGPEELISMSTDSRRRSDGGWVHEEEFHEMVFQAAEEERKDNADKNLSFQNFIRENHFEKSIKTTTESIEDFFPDKIEQSSHAYQSPSTDKKDSTEVSVNENAVLSSQFDDNYCSSDDDGNDIFADEDEEAPNAPNNLLEDSFTMAFQIPERSRSDEDNFSDQNGSNESPEPRARGSSELRNASDKGKEPFLNETDDDVHFTGRIKRPRVGITDGQRSRKRGRFFDQHGSPEISQKYTDTKKNKNMKSHQAAIRPKNQEQLSKLNFPVVKNPNGMSPVLPPSGVGLPIKAKEEAVSKSQSSSRSTVDVQHPDSTPTKHSSQPQSYSANSGSIISDTYASEMMSNLFESFNFPTNRQLGCFKPTCPIPDMVCSTINDNGFPSVVYQKAHYSDTRDVPGRTREYAGREFRLEGSSIHYLPDFDSSGRSPAMFGEQGGTALSRNEQDQYDQQLRESTSSRVWEFAPVPPTRSEVVQWFEDLLSQQNDRTQRAREALPERLLKPNALSQIEGPTQRDNGSKYPRNGQKTSVERQTQNMSIMSLEIHVNTRGVLAPNPEEDEISCVFWCIQSEKEDLIPNGNIPGVHVGMIYQGEDDVPADKIVRALRIETDHQTTELDLINRVVDIVRSYDPDIITGYEVHNNSWGYLIERAKKKYDFELCDELSKVKSQAHGRFGKDNDRWGFNKTSAVRTTGRHIINIWRAMRGELNLLQYTMENVVFHVLHRRIPHYSHRDLTTWYQSGKPRNIMKVVSYFASRVQMNLEVLESNELISRTSEQASLLGVDFFSVFSRGSQFKVESLMFRIAKPENFVLISPSRKQVGQQNALECLPLVMEPQSDFYTSPVVVLDFQSLYPSVMIAYNYCYSTFLGRAQHWRGRNKMGFMDYERQPQLLDLLKDKINIAPNGMIYTKPEVRTSLLARMLSEILETRVMVKAGMKIDKDDKILQRLLNNRQLALKLIANVTYGYTSASFSGRMPCSEIADSIVQTGRETLEKAIALIHSVERWGAEVVYGDTDSLFIHLKGRTRDEAFDIGEEIAQTVTDMNPRPVKLKFEKVYHPCVLLAKKRYVGFKYEHRDQKEPEFDAKGIETVRRDGTPAEQKIEEKALKILFRTADLSHVKKYFQSQCTKIMQGNVSIQDFCFAREVRLGTYSERGLPPPGALLSTKKMLEDPRLEPQYGERVPYVVVTGAPGSRLIDRCVTPETLLNNAQLDLDAEYYIIKNLIPPLERIFNLVGANIRQWYDEMPKFHRVRRVQGVSTSTANPSAALTSRKTLESYMKSSSCLICKSTITDPSSATTTTTDNRIDTNIPLCQTCQETPHVSLLHLLSRRQQAEKRVSDLNRICRSCMGVPFGDDVVCDSKDCPIFYSRTRHATNWRHVRAALDPVVGALEKRGDEGLDW